MIEKQYKKTLAEQIESKNEELDKVIVEVAGASVTQKALKCIVIERLKGEIQELLHLYRYEELPPSKEDILNLIDKSLDEQNKEDFMRLTNLLKTMDIK
jgi:uncharacterized protein YpiB (UPF0302 family)